MNNEQELRRAIASELEELAKLVPERSNVVRGTLRWAAALVADPKNETARWHLKVNG
jgi:hypothetical protein